jgi:hypothetical protein
VVWGWGSVVFIEVQICEANIDDPIMEHAFFVESIQMNFLKKKEGQFLALPFKT